MDPLAEIEGPVGLAFEKSGDLYASQPQARKVSRVSLDSSLRVIIEGLKSSRDPAFDASGNLHVAETDRGRIILLAGDF